MGCLHDWLIDGRKVVAVMNPKLQVLFLIFLGVMLVGCAPAENAQQSRSGQSQQAVDGHDPALDTVQLAAPVPGQRDNPMLAPGDYGDQIEAINNTLSTLIESLQLNDLGRAETCLSGLDEGGARVTLEELQREVELLHPVQWGLDQYRPAGAAGALVTLSITVAGGTERQVGPFSMFNNEGLWVVHYNSFADSFHAVAGHLINGGKDV